jgi:REP element-mobilizing transposase RayT
MKSKSYPNRQSIRFPKFDYSQNGVYVITISTIRKICIFGDVIKGKMILNDIGLETQRCWKEIPAHFADVALLDYIVMPNHVHGIIVLKYNRRADTACRVPTEGNFESFSKPTVNSIPTIIRSYKSAVTRAVNQKFPRMESRVWQPRYYESIIRNSKELHNVIDYIRSNPANWDKEFGGRHHVS